MIRLEGKFLLIDTSNTDIFCGVWENGEFLALKSSRIGALQGLFGLVKKQLEELSVELKDFAGVFFCKGPGSTLGIRVASMAVRTWMRLEGCRHWKVYSYESLKATGCWVLANGGKVPFAVISEYKNKKWNFLEVAGDGGFGELLEVDGGFLEGVKVPIYYTPQRKMVDLGIEVERVDYEIGGIEKYFYRDGFLELEEAPEIFYHELPSYKKWDGERHK